MGRPIVCLYSVHIDKLSLGGMLRSVLPGLSPNSNTQSVVVVSSGERTGRCGAL